MAINRDRFQVTTPFICDVFGDPVDIYSNNKNGGAESPAKGRDQDAPDELITLLMEFANSYVNEEEKDFSSNDLFATDFLVPLFEGFPGFAEADESYDAYIPQNKAVIKDLVKLRYI